MRLMSKLANSRLSRAGIIATGVGSSFVPTYEMLNPPAIYAEQIEQSPNLEELLSNLSTQENRDEALLRAFEEGKQGKIPHGSNLIDEVVNVLFKGYHPDFLDITDIISLYKRIGTISTNLPSKEEKVKLYTLASRRYEELVEKLIKELMKLRNPTHIPYAEVVGFGRSAELYEKAENSSKAKELYKKVDVVGGILDDGLDDEEAWKVYQGKITNQ